MSINQKSEDQIINIRRIKEYSFSLNEILYVPDPAKDFKIEVGMQLLFTIETNLVFLVARVYYHYPDSAPGQFIVDITVQNVFEIQDLKNYQVGPTEIRLPQKTIITLVSLSISHTRALLAKNIAGTVFQENVMGIINGEAVARHFFPVMFESQGTSITEQTLAI